MFRGPRSFLVASALFGSAFASQGTNLLTNGDCEQGKVGWEGFGKGFAVDRAVIHSGKGSLRCQNTAVKEVSGAMQVLELDQQKPVPLVVSGWSKAEGVNGKPSPHYSIYCDIEYATDTRPNRVDLPGQTIQFQTGTHDWAFGERIIQPAAPIKWVKFYVLFRHRYTGQVWFDDLYIGPMGAGPLTGALADFPVLPQQLTPQGFQQAAGQLPRDRMLVHVAERKTQPYHVDPMRLWLGGKLAREGESVVQQVCPWEFPRGFVAPPEASPFTGVWLRRTWGEVALDVHTQGKEGAGYRYTIALPPKVSIRHVEFDGWEPSFDDVQVCRLGDRVVLSVLTETQTGSDRVSFHLLTEERAKPEPRAPVRVRELCRTLRTDDGLELDVCRDGWLDRLRLGGQDVTDTRISNSSVDALAVGAGFYVGDLFGEGFELVAGDVAATDDGARQRAELKGMDLFFDATYTVRGDRIDIEAELEDRLGTDRAVDVVLKLPLAVDVLTWWDDITDRRIVSAKKPIKTSIYPWATLTSPDGSAGLTLAIPPRRPCEFRFHCEPPDRLFYVRIPLGISQESKRPGRTAFALTLFRTDGKWGFRDGARRYYEAFPDAFRRIAKKEGGWLFACPTAKLENPEDYAYHEGGPGGWQLDEELGILTCPYRIPTQRQIVFPSLPKSHEEAMEWIERLSRTLQPSSWRVRAANVDESARHSGKRCVHFERTDGKSMIAVHQDVRIDQETPKPIAIGGRCRAESVTGKRDNHFGLWADLFLADGTRQYGQCVSFNTGTHDWEAAEKTFAPGKPIQMVRLNVLMRRSHSGRAWFDDIYVKEAGSDQNLVQNPGFEQARPHSYATMMQNCASHDATGRPYIVRRDNVGADVLPKNPIYNVVYSVNCDPDLFDDRDALTVGKFELDLIESMLERNPKLDGIYLDSVRGWVSRYPNFRREHFRYVDYPLSYHPRTGRLMAPGWLHTYEFMAELQKRLSPNGKVVFPNIGNNRRNPFFYFVCDVIGLEGGLRGGPFESQLNFYRTLSYHKPVLVMDYLEVIGRPTRHATREGFERFWKWCALYGCHPSIGRTCVEAYERFGDVYRRFREPLKKLGAAGWEPVTHATVGPDIRVERFGNAETGLYFTLLNPTGEAKKATLEIDVAALGLAKSYVATDLLSGKEIAARPIDLLLAAEGLAIVRVRAGRPR